MSKEGICHRDGKERNMNEVCDCWEPAHPSVIEARREYEMTRKAFCAALKQYKEDGCVKALSVKLNDFLETVRNLHLRSYIHRSGRFAKSANKKTS